MPDIVKQVQYFYTEVPDKPGEGARILTMLKDAGVNLLATRVFPKGGGPRLISSRPMWRLFGRPPEKGNSAWWVQRPGS